MSYLTDFDYAGMISDVSMQQVISGNIYLRQSAETKAIKEISSYLRRKYNVDEEFTDTLRYNKEAVYKAGARVYLHADENQHSLYYAKDPQPRFDLNASYRKGDKVFYKDHVYEALQDSPTLSHDAALQLGTTNNLPLGNVPPDDRLAGRDYWKDEGAYEVPAGKIKDTNFFTQGDNRDQLILMYTLDVTIYHLYARQAPKPIPDDRIDRYNAAIAWCRNVMRGDATSELRQAQTEKATKFRYGSNVKNQNSY